MAYQSGPRSKRKAPHGKKGGGRFGGGKRTFRKRSCMITAEKKGVIDYKDTELLSKLVSDRGKIFPRTHTNACAKKQRELARAVKKARAIGFLKIARSK